MYTVREPRFLTTHEAEDFDFPNRAVFHPLRERDVREVNARRRRNVLELRQTVGLHAVVHRFQVDQLTDFTLPL